MSERRLWFLGARPRTLALGLSVVLFGLAAALAASPTRSSLLVRQPRFWALSLLCLVVALAFQIAINYANDYSDGIRGTDAGRNGVSSELRRTGSIRLVALGVAPKKVLRAAAAWAGVGCLAGLVIIVLTGRWWLLAVGLACLLGIWFYTGGRHPYGYAGFGELAVFVFFGLVAVLGTQLVVGGRVNLFGLFFSLAAGLLSVAAIMINNLRDITEDAAAGKKTLAVRMGRTWYRRSLQLTYVLVVILIVLAAVVQTGQLAAAGVGLVPLVLVFWHLNRVGGGGSPASGNSRCEIPDENLSLMFASNAVLTLVLAVGAVVVLGIATR